MKEMRKERNRAEILEAMDTCDQTFINSDPEYAEKILRLYDFRTVTPERRFEINHWDPVNSEKDILGEYIRKKKKN